MFMLMKSQSKNVGSFLYLSMLFFYASSTPYVSMFSFCALSLCYKTYVSSVNVFGVI
jgi:hypothetical protein